MHRRFGLFPVRSPLLGESRLISLPPGTEMFQFPGLAPLRVTGLAPSRVSPFGHPGITARVQLPQAYRSLPRPSSPLDAKASTVCLIAFDLKLCVDCVHAMDTSNGKDSSHWRISRQRPIRAHHPSFDCQRAARPREAGRQVKSNANRKSNDECGRHQRSFVGTASRPLLDAPERR
jgi:hypothetical protein